MATNLEIQREQRKILFMLLEIKGLNKDLTIKGLDRQIQAVRSEMNQEDVAWVEKMVDELKDNLS
jgi:hypothetical protein